MNSPNSPNRFTCARGRGSPDSTITRRSNDSMGDSLFGSTSSSMRRNLGDPRRRAFNAASTRSSRSQSPIDNAAPASTTRSTKHTLAARSSTVRRGVVTGIPPTNVTSAGASRAREHSTPGRRTTNPVGTVIVMGSPDRSRGSHHPRNLAAEVPLMTVPGGVTSNRARHLTWKSPARSRATRTPTKGACQVGPRSPWRLMPGEPVAEALRI
jgi:hypothetical protein